jgi:hypothetical protein
VPLILGALDAVVPHRLKYDFVESADSAAKKSDAASDQENSTTALLLALDFQRPIT